MPLLLDREPCLQQLNKNPSLAVSTQSQQILREFLAETTGGSIKNYGSKQYRFLVRICAAVD